MSEQKPPAQRSHRRKNLLTGDWVLVSPQRLLRPWQGEQSDATQIDNAVSYDPECYLCPGNQRAAGPRNPAYTGVYVFDNDYPALQDIDDDHPEPLSPLFQWATERGVCRVVCFSPDHSKTLSHLEVPEVAAVVEVWAAQSDELGGRFPDGSVQVFENKGEMMGCSNPHPHGQIWAQSSIPSSLRRELDASAEYFAAHGRPLLEDYARAELTAAERLVLRNDHFLAVVPFWATWPFETMILPVRHMPRLSNASAAERHAFASVLRRLSICYDRLFGVSFPYSGGLHQAPYNGRWDEAFGLHMHFYPPLLRSAKVRKFMVGYEMLAEAQRDLTPESAADALRSLSEAQSVQET